MVDSLNVNLGDRSYAIRFGADLADDIRGESNQLAGAGRRVAVLTDRNVAEQQGQSLKTLFGASPTLVVEAGEGSKSLACFGRVLDFLAEQKIDRSGALFAVGGGVIGDLGGFAAASYLRG